MPSFFSKLRGKSGHKSSPSTDSPSNPPSGGDQPTYSIQPHPAKTNNPADLVEPPQTGGGLNTNPEIGAFHARDPYVPSKEIRDSLPEPATRDELRARQAELNSSNQ